VTEPLRQGDVWWVDLDPPRGREQGFRRPAIVLQSDALNLNTVVVVPITTAAPHRSTTTTMRPLRAGDGGLREDSYAQCHQLFTVSRESEEALADVELAVLYTLDIR